MARTDAGILPINAALPKLFLRTSGIATQPKKLANRNINLRNIGSRRSLPNAGERPTSAPAISGPVANSYLHVGNPICSIKRYHMVESIWKLADAADHQQ